MDVTTPQASGLKSKKMKKVLILALALISFGAMAQEKEKSERTPLSAEQMATLQTKRMTLALDLSEDQQAKVKAIQLEKAKIRKAKMVEHKARKDSKGFKKPTAEERYAKQEQRLDMQIAQKAEMKNILSTEQYQRWEKMAMRKGKRKRKRGNLKKGGNKGDRNKE